MRRRLVKVPKPKERSPITEEFALRDVVEARLETKRSVEVALVARREETVVEARVEEAVERKPLSRARVVEVACSFVESLVKGKVKPGEEERVPLERERFPPMVRAPREPPGKA